MDLTINGWQTEARRAERLREAAARRASPVVPSMAPAQFDRDLPARLAAAELAGRLKGERLVAKSATRLAQAEAKAAAKRARRRFNKLHQKSRENYEAVQASEECSCFH